MSCLDSLKTRYELVVIGGGVHGAAAALEAARRGHEVLLVERGDFCAGTSANSLKIIHGGLRYLGSGDLRRSRESAREQRALMGLAPHLVRMLPCLVGTGHGAAGSKPIMALGLWLYDHVVCAGLGPWPRSRILPVEEANRRAGGPVFDDCTGAALWHDAQLVDSERLVLAYLKTAEHHGADIRNYTEAVEVIPGDRPRVALRAARGDTASVQADAVIDTASLVDPHPAWARAVNLVIDRPPGDCAFGRKPGGGTEDAGRLFFATPFGGRTIVGTWYFPQRPDERVQLEPAELRRCITDLRNLLPGPAVTASEVTLVHLGRLPVADPKRPLSLLEKPLIRPAAGDPRVVSVTGVKYTTARPTAAKAVSAVLGRPPAAAAAGGDGWFYGTPESKESLNRETIEQLAAHLQPERAASVGRRLCRQYGGTALAITRRAAASPAGFELIPGQDAIRAEIDYCVEAEHCRTLADFVLRRSGLGSLGAPPEDAIRYCAKAMAARLDWPEERVSEQIESLKSHYQRHLETPD